MTADQDVRETELDLLSHLFRDTCPEQDFGQLIDGLWDGEQST